MSYIESQTEAFDIVAELANADPCCENGYCTLCNGYSGKHKPTCLLLRAKSWLERNKEII